MPFIFFALESIPEYFPTLIQRTSQLATQLSSLTATLKKACEFRLCGSEPLQITFRTPDSLGYRQRVWLSFSAISTDLSVCITPTAQPRACKRLWSFTLKLPWSRFSGWSSFLESRSSNPVDPRQTLLFHGNLVTQNTEEPLHFYMFKVTHFPRPAQRLLTQGDTKETQWWQTWLSGSCSFEHCTQPIQSCLALLSVLSLHHPLSDPIFCKVP